MRATDTDAFLPALLEVQTAAPHPFARGTAAAIALLLVAAVAWASVGRVDEVAVAPGKLVPRGEVKPVQVAEQGVVRAVRVAEGERVREAQVLLELDPTDAEADRDRVSHELAQARREQARLAALWGRLDAGAPAAAPGPLVEARRSAAAADGLGARAETGEPGLDPLLGRDPGPRAFGAVDCGAGAAGWLDCARLDSEIAAHRAEVRTLVEEARRARAERTVLVERVAGLEESVPLLARRADATRRLAEGKLAAEHAYLEIEQARVEAEGELRAQRARLAELEAAVHLAEGRRAAVEAGFRRDLLARLQEADHRASGLEEEWRKAEHRLGLRTVRAPADGVVQQLAVSGPGTVVAPSAPVMVVVPDGVDVEVEARLANRDVGFVREGQAVVVKLEAFPFTRFGTIQGTVTRVSADAVADERQGLSYAMRVALGAQHLDAGGSAVALAPGMAAAVEVRTGERRLISFFLEPLLRYRDESLRER
ncbi:MAG: HlyD family type I secretion periplasmic adaptor subunit [Gammaproteobacteria bacterium]|jgi:hemolysin D|nr:HlyD family type I secretion periplasmic adaptor subunit [Gammaproteobacteria bacterium]